MKDIPYSELNQDKRAYKIMLLRDQHGNTFADIAKEFEISAGRAIQIYKKLKLKQIRLYTNHIAAVLGYESTLQVKNVFDNAYECYQDRTYACAYLEKKYKDILIEYRDGEPGMPTQFIRNMPPFKPKLSQKTVARVIELRDVEKASFVTIAKCFIINKCLSLSMHYRKRRKAKKKKRTYGIIISEDTILLKNAMIC